MVETDLAFLTIEIPPSDVLFYERDVSFSFTEKVSALGKCQMSSDENYSVLHNNIPIIGGTLGLFTGMSLLSFIEVGFWLFRIFYKLVFGANNEAKETSNSQRVAWDH